MDRPLLSRLRSAGALWAGIPIGLLAGILLGLFRTVRPYRWPDGVPFDGVSVPFWPYVVVGGVVGLLPLVGHLVHLALIDARRRAIAADHPDALIVSATANPRTTAALATLAGPPSVTGRSLLLVASGRGLVVSVLGFRGTVTRSIEIARSWIGGAEARERSAMTAQGRDVWVTVARGDGSIVEVPFALRSDDLGEPSIALLTAFAERVASERER